MAKLSDSELSTFRSRVFTAVQNGYSVVAGRQFAAMSAEAGAVESPDGKEGSPAHVLALADHCLAIRSGKGKKKRAKPEDKKPAKKAPAKKAAKKAAADKDKWTDMGITELREWASVYEIPGRSKMSRGKLAAAVRKAAPPPRKKKSR